jgi:hypothetical protein
MQFNEGLLHFLVENKTEFIEGFKKVFISIKSSKDKKFIFLYFL